MSKGSFFIPSVLITGANRGIGLEFVKKFINLCTPASLIFACCRSPEEAAELQEIKKTQGNLHILQLDVTNQQDITDAVAHVEEIVQEAGLHLLINNAGAMDRSSLENTTVENMMENYRVNAVAPVMMVKEFLPLLKRLANSREEVDLNQTTVVNITSKIGSISDNGSGGRYPYRGSKVGAPYVTNEW